MSNFNFITIYYSKRKSLLLLPVILFLFYIITTSFISPLLETNNKYILFKITNYINSKICHQYSPRCPTFFNIKIKLCTRCFAFYLTMLFFNILYLFIDFKVSDQLKIKIFIVFILPLAVDGLTQFLNFRESTFFLRMITGVFGAIGVSIILTPFYINRYSYHEY